MFTKLEAVIDPIDAGQCRGKHQADAKCRPSPLLQKSWEDVGRIGKKVRSKILSRRTFRQLGQVFHQLAFAVPPGEVSIGLGKSRLGNGLVWGLSTRKMRTPSSIQNITVSRSSSHNPTRSGL